MPVDGSYERRLAQLEADLDRLVRRLGSLTSHGWRPREAAVRVLAQNLADLAATAEGRALRPVPALPVYGLADVVAVLGGDVLISLSGRETTDLLDATAELVDAALRNTV